MTSDEEPYRWRWGELVRAASSASRWLAAKGVQQGNVCALIIPHNKNFYPLYLGVSALGALPSVLAYPNVRLHPDKFRQGLEGMARRSGLQYVLAERDLAERLAPLFHSDESTIKEALYPLDPAEGTFSDGGSIAEHPPTTNDEACLLQHSSGTTGLQKPVTLTHRAVLEHLHRYGEAIAASTEDRIVSWLPLYHDMGLIAAFYLPLVHGIPLVQLDPLEWVASPAILMKTIAREKATLCWLPNFAYSFMADRIREEDLKGVRLDSVRMLINCSEPVRAESHDRFHRRFSPYGLRREALGTCYAMAETTFAVTQSTPRREARRLAVDRAELLKGNVVPTSESDPGARTCVSSGSPISGCSIRIVDENRQAVPAGKVGEISISSVSLFNGYRNYPEKTAEVLSGGWYHSGDCGFVHDGEYFIIGRRNDLIIIAGNNVFPEDVEDAIGNAPGAIPGRVVAFGVEDERIGTEVLCVIVESQATDGAERRALQVAVMEAGIGVGVNISRVYVVPPRWLIKSSAGKPARSTNRTRALEELVWK